MSLFYVTLAGGLIVTIATGIVSIFKLLIIITGGISATTSVSMLCQFYDNTNTTIPCPTPWNFNSYSSAYMELASYATVVFIAAIIFVVFNIIFKIVQTAITLTNLNHVQKQQQYDQIHEPQRQHLDRLFAQADGSNYQ